MVGKAYLGRGAIIWVAARIAFGALLLAFSASPLRYSADISAALVAIVSLVSYAELRRHHEGNLLHNLGVPVLVVVAISAVPAIAGEFAIAVAQTVAR